MSASPRIILSRRWHPGRNAIAQPLPHLRLRWRYRRHNDPSPARERVLRLFEQKRIPLQIVIALPSLDGIKRAVELGLGVAVLPHAAVEHEVARGTLVAKAFAEGTFTRPIGLLVRKGKYLDRASQAVLDSFKAARQVERASAQ